MPRARFFVEVDLELAVALAFPGFGNGSMDDWVQLIQEGESDRLEFKSSPRSGDLRETVCAMANDLPGHGRPGYLVVGLDDQGRPTGIQVTDKVLRDLAALRDEGSILPLPHMEVRRAQWQGADIALVIVYPSPETPVRYRGRVWVRVGPTNRVASAEEELRLVERRRAAQLPFDHRPAPEATMEDLDLDYVKTQYLPRAVAPEILEANRRPLEQQLHSLRLMRNGRPTWGGLLGFGREVQDWLPGAYIQFVRFEGADVTSAIRDQKTLTGRLEDVLRLLDELLELNVSIRTWVSGVVREQRQVDYPVDALRQLVRNAVMHRNYEGTHAPVRVHWFSDRVSVWSPGGLYGQVNKENFGTGVTDYRNPLVAEVMHHLGFAQRFGMGIPLARKRLAENGNPPPDFELAPTHVSVTVYPAA